MNNLQLTMSITNYVEEHLHEKITMENLSNQLHYSQYYLLHEFKETTQQSLANYIKRRRLNEASRALMYSNKRIIDIGMEWGYESQRAFTKAFKQLFKITPAQFRLQKKEFFIQEPFVWEKMLFAFGKQDLIIRLGTEKDQDRIVNFVKIMKGAFPYLEITEYFETLKLFTKNQNCFVACAKGEVVGLLLYNPIKSQIENLMVLPTCWDLMIEEMLLDYLFHKKCPDKLFTTTFREADKLDIGYRHRLLRLGFEAKEQLVEFNYPTEQMVLNRD